MPFIPETRPIVHSKARNAAILDYARAALEAPWDGIRHTVPAQDFPDFGPESNKRAGRAIKGGSAVSPTGCCPETGRALHLALRRDSSCLILRDGDDAAWEMLPAIFTLSTETWSLGSKNVAFDLRRQTCPRLRLYPSAAGIHGAIVLGETLTPITKDEDVAALRDMLTRAVETAAGEVLAADGIVDPRTTPVLPAGGRYAPFSTFPAADPAEPSLGRLRAAAAALARLFDHDRGDYYACLDRTPPQTPWRQPSGSALVRVMPDNTDYCRALRVLARDPRLGLSDALRHGDGSTVVLATNCNGAPTRHEIIAGMGVLHEIFGTHDSQSITALIAAEKAAQRAALET